RLLPRAPLAPSVGGAFWIAWRRNGPVSPPHGRLGQLVSAQDSTAHRPFWLPIHRRFPPYSITLIVTRAVGDEVETRGKKEAGKVRSPTRSPISPRQSFHHRCATGLPRRCRVPGPERAPYPACAPKAFA